METASRLNCKALGLITFFALLSGAKLVVETSRGLRLSSDGTILLRSDAAQEENDSIHLPRAIVRGIHNLAINQGQCQKSSDKTERSVECFCQPSEIFKLPNVTIKHPEVNGGQTKILPPVHYLS